MKLALVRKTMRQLKRIEYPDRRKMTVKQREDYDAEASAKSRS